MATIARANTPLSALRHFNFRLYFIGQLISLSGTWMQRVAQGWLVFQLTGSEFALGLVAAAQGFPMLLLIPLGGVVSDRYSRRTILIMSFTVQMLQAILLAILTFAELVEVWHIVALSAALGVATAFEMPARQTFVYDLVGREDIQSGVALNAITINAANILGPTAAGILLVQIGAAWCFSLNGVTFLASLGALAWMQLAPFSRQMTSTNPWAELVDGLRYAIRHPTIAPLLILGTSNAVFGINVLVTLLPSFADVTLDSPEKGLAAVSAAMGVGAILSGLANLEMGRRYGRGRVALIFTLASPAVFFFLAISQTTGVAAVWAAGFGFTLTMFFVTTNTLLQHEVEEGYRGRIMGLWMLALWGLPLTTTVLMGSVADVIGTDVTYALCALMMVAISLLVIWRNRHWPKLA